MASIMEIMQLCRLCLVKDQVNIPIFEEQGDIRQIFLKITACLPVKVSKEDDLPKKICDGCLYKLELLYQFWNTTVNAEKQLLTWLSQAGVDSAKKVTDAAMAVVSEAQEGADLAGGIILKQEAIDPAETRGDSGAAETISSEAQSYILQQQQLPYQPFAYGQVGMEGLAGESSGANSVPSATVTSNDSEQPPAKRLRRAAAPTQPLVTPETESDEDDIDTSETKITKTEDESEGEDPEPTSFVGVPSDNEQPGPSGVGKAPSTEAPSTEEASASFSKCRTCGEKFKSPKLLRVHRYKLHQQPKQECSVCGKKFKFSCNLRQHQTLVHSDRKGHECDVCGKTFKLIYALTSHRKFHDVGEHRYKCDQCPAGFHFEYHFKRHYRIHSNDIYTCEICDKQFKQFHYLAKHKKTHDPEYQKPTLTCKYCKKVYNSNEGLTQHVQCVHEGKAHICEMCGKSIASSRSLKDHKNIHAGVKPYCCEICGKSFTSRSLLRTHHVIHAKEKPHKCDACGKTFTQRSSLKVHIRSAHTKEKPYECHICQKKFITRTLMKMHAKVHGTSMCGGANAENL